MRCARDREAFVTLVTYGTEISYCPKCGTWIDPEEVAEAERVRRAISSRAPRPKLAASR